MQSFLNAAFAIGTIGLQIFLVAVIISAVTKTGFARWVTTNAHIVLRFVFIGAMVGSLVFELLLSYPPCLLCWYQRMAIFPIAILVLATDIRASALLRKQVLILSIIGFAIALFHNYIDIFPTGLDVCGSGTSCLARYVYEFGYVTIPMMSATVLLGGIVISVLAARYPQKSLAA
jgi:hypothetical protein